MQVHKKIIERDIADINFWEAIEIIRKFYISKLVARQYSQHVHNVIYEKINDKCQRLLSILSNSNK